MSTPSISSISSSMPSILPTHPPALSLPVFDSFSSASSQVSASSQDPTSLKSSTSLQEGPSLETPQDKIQDAVQHFFTSPPKGSPLAEVKVGDTTVTAFKAPNGQTLSTPIPDPKDLLSPMNYHVTPKLESRSALTAPKDLRKIAGRVNAPHSMIHENDSQTCMTSLRTAVQLSSNPNSGDPKFLSGRIFKLEEPTGNKNYFGVHEKSGNFRTFPMAGDAITTFPAKEIVPLYDTFKKLTPERRSKSPTLPALAKEEGKTIDAYGPRVSSDASSSSSSSSSSSADPKAKRRRTNPQATIIQPTPASPQQPATIAQPAPSSNAQTFPSSLAVTLPRLHGEK